MSDIQRSEALRQVAHDLKNPLTAVRVLAEMLLDEAGPTLAGDLTDIVEAVDVAAVTAEGLSDLARLEAGDEPTYAPDTVDLGDIVRDVASRAAFSRAVQVLEGSGEARADDSAIMRALNGVLLNGRRMLKPPKKLVIRVDGPMIEVFHPEVELDADSRDALLSLYGGPVLKARRVRAAALGLGYAREVTEAIGGTFELEMRDDGMRVRMVFTPT
ncbi:MAG: HAMP domain-containing histidine kinase [Alphaproteobacteria bacterium]|nr:HAMP domain-containing histidine kinase [Alphaproteobacteria bacterium]